MIRDVNVINAFSHRVEAESCGTGLITLDRTESLALEIEFDITNAEDANMRVSHQTRRFELEPTGTTLDIRTGKIEAVISSSKQLEFFGRENWLAHWAGSDFEMDIDGWRRGNYAGLLSLRRDRQQH